MRAVLKDLLEHARKGGYVPGNGPEVYHLWELGYREAAPLALEHQLPLHPDKAALHHRLGLDVPAFVANTLRKESPWRSFRLAANENLPAALILKHKQTFIERCEQVLTGRPGVEDLDADGADDFAARKNECGREAFVILSRLAPARAKRHAALFKDDPPLEAAPEIGWRDLADEYRRQKEWAARLDAAKRLFRRSQQLSEGLAREVEEEITGHLRDLAGYERLCLAALLTIHGNRKGEAVLDAYLRGSGHLWNAHLVFYDLIWCAENRPEPFAGRARRKLLAAVAGHANPNVRAAAVRAAERCLQVRDEQGRQYPLIRALVDQLGPEQDWRVRAAAGLALRHVFKDLWPEWDYDPFGDKEKLRRAADDLRKWWEVHEAKVVWVAPADSVVGFGYFQVGK